MIKLLWKRVELSHPPLLIKKKPLLENKNKNPNL
jgi:hypothetical protein